MGCLYSPLPKEIQCYGVNYNNLEIIQALNNIDLTDKQRKVLNLYIEGYTEIDMGITMNTSHQDQHKLVIKISNKLIKYLIGE